MSDFLKNLNLIDLHIHVGGAVAPHILWRLAQQQGFNLPVANYWQFKQMVTATPDKVRSLDEYLKILHEWTEKIQSSPLAVEQSVYEIISKEYRSSNVTAIELRFNPMKRNSGGELDLDHIIHAAIRGMDRVSLEYGVEAGLIFCLAREFDFERNEILIEKAIRYRDRGVIGIDLAGTERKRFEQDQDLLKSYGKLFKHARDNGLRTTVHTGETSQTNGELVMDVVRHLKPERIGHGIRAAYNKDALKMLNDEGVVLELCPTCNLRTQAIKDTDELKHIIDTFAKNDVGFTINTDGPYLLNTNLRREFQLLTDNNILDENGVLACLDRAKQASFLQLKNYDPKTGHACAHQDGEE